MPERNKPEISYESMISMLAYPEYKKLEECWQTVDDCLAGQKVIKEKCKYLPANDWQRKHKDQYLSYLHRALFPSETIDSLDIYMGLFSIGDPEISVPDDMKFIVDNASVDNDSLKNVQIRLNEEQMTHGLRCMLLERANSDEAPFFIREYTARKFLRAHFVNQTGEKPYPDLILLDESTEYYDIETFCDKADYRILVLALDADGFYYQRIVKFDELANRKLDVKHPPLDDRTVYPSYKGNYMKRIPFVWCNAKSLSGTKYDYPPILPLSQTELALYIAMANHSQHIYMNTQEILFFKGINPNEIPKDFAVGSGSYIALKNDNADAKYVSTNGVGFTAENEEITMLKDTIEKKRLSLMSAKSHQSSNVVGMVQNSTSAPLRTIVNTAGDAITLILKYMAEWMGKTIDEINAIRYTPSTMFANPKVNLSEFIALCKSVYSGEVQMLEEELYTIAKDSGYITGKMSFSDFKKRYEIEDTERREKTLSLPKTNSNPFVKQETEEAQNENA